MAQLDILKTGFILYVIHYEACIHFYEKILKLNVLYKKENLTCFDFHGSYLMVEVDDEYLEENLKLDSRPKTCIRINVADVKKACINLDENNIKYAYGEYDWGTIAKFHDPDLNLIGFRSAKEHDIDIIDGN